MGHEMNMYACCVFHMDLCEGSVVCREHQSGGHEVVHVASVHLYSKKSTFTLQLYMLSQSCIYAMAYTFVFYIKHAFIIVD